MSKKPNDPDLKRLRTEAEKKIAATPPTPQSAHAAHSPHSAEKLLHELQVHQVELEMQNEVLRQAQIDLEESRDRYVDLYDFSPVAYLTLTGEGLIQGINLTGATLLGVARADLLQRNFSSFVVYEDRNRWLRRFMAAWQHAARQDCELALQRADGLRLEMRLDYQPIAVEDGAATLMIALTDIGARKHMEDLSRQAHMTALKLMEDAIAARTQIEAGQSALQESERKLRSILDSALDGIVLANVRTQRLAEFNPAFCRMVGYSGDELATMSAADLHPPQNLPDVMAAFEQCARGDISLALDIPVLRKDGTVLLVDVKGSPLRLGDEDYVLGIFRDITERKAAEANRAEQLEELRRWHDVMLGREKRILELKHEVNAMLAEAGEPPRYPSAENHDGDEGADRDA